MQTFLPYPHFMKSAQVLDYRRLGKQRVEAKQIHQCLTGTGSLRWKNHPAVRMWLGHEDALAYYGYCVCIVWIGKGYRDTLLSYFLEFINPSDYDLPIDYNLPTWFGDEKFHLAHRSNLLRKMPSYYSKFWADCPNDLPYVWPR